MRLRLNSRRGMPSACNYTIHSNALHPFHPILSLLPTSSINFYDFMWWHWVKMHDSTSLHFYYLFILFAFPINRQNWFEGRPSFVRSVLSAANRESILPLAFINGTCSPPHACLRECICQPHIVNMRESMMHGNLFLWLNYVAHLIPLRADAGERERERAPSKLRVYHDNGRSHTQPRRAHRMLQ